MTGGTRRIAVLAGALILAAVAGSCSRPTRVSTVTVSLDRPWTDAGIVLRSGSTVSITATGSNQAGPGVSFGPGGLQGPTEWTRGVVVQGAPPQALIARIGDHGIPFYVGKSFSGRMWEGGTLYLGINDVAPGQNTGSWTVEVTVR